jgi:malonate decarboxylase beta subunit
MNNSFIELKGRERALALLDRHSFIELLDPFDRLESPHLPLQGIVPESDDGMIIARGRFNGQDAVVLSIEGAFQGGGIGEVCGTKIAASLEHVLEDNRNGKRIIPIIIFDTGGVRLQEANYGLLIISEIQSAIVALREHVPVIGLIPGNVGCFGGMSITASLCSQLIMTETARFGMNGPEVIEQEAGLAEFDSRNRRLIWDTIGGKARYETGLVDQLVADDIEDFRKAIQTAIDAPVKTPRTQQVDYFLPRLLPGAASIKTTASTPSRGRTWFSALTEGAMSISDLPSVLVADKVYYGLLTRFIAVVPDSLNAYGRAANGEVGLLEGWTLAKYVREAIEADKDQNEKRAIICIIDVPSQAYGRKEEELGLQFACAAAVDAYANARMKGHKLTGLIVGNAISGAFLAHGLQAPRLIALDDAAINVQAMSKKSTARITKRTIEELEAATQKVPAMAYDIRNYYTLGALDRLIEEVNADRPTSEEIQKVNDVLSTVMSLGESTLEHRLLTVPAMDKGRATSILVRKKLAEQWH